jgi:hypothetical protein
MFHVPGFMFALISNLRLCIARRHCSKYERGIQSVKPDDRMELLQRSGRQAMKSQGPEQPSKELRVWMAAQCTCWQGW